MTIIRIERFTVDPADAEQLVTRRNALVDAVRRTVPGLLDARLARLDERVWVDIWRWDSRTSAESAIAQARAGAFPAAPAFALTREATTEFLEVVDER